jgi:hypothetical protein
VSIMLFWWMSWVNRIRWGRCSVVLQQRVFDCLCCFYLYLRECNVSLCIWPRVCCVCVVFCVMVCLPGIYWFLFVCFVHFANPCRLYSPCNWQCGHLSTRDIWLVFFFRFLAVSCHMISSAFDTFVGSRTVGFWVAVELTSCTLYDSMFFIGCFYSYFHVV